MIITIDKEYKDAVHKYFEDLRWRVRCQDIDGALTSIDDLEEFVASLVTVAEEVQTLAQSLKVI